jgi:hypothetical protein
MNELLVQVNDIASQNSTQWFKLNMTLKLKTTYQEVNYIPLTITFSNVFLAQKILRDLKGKISAQSKKNFVLERDVRYLDSRIALLIQNRMALDEQNEFAARIEDAMDTKVGQFPDDRKVQVYIPSRSIRTDCSNMEICFIYYRLNPDIFRPFVVWLRCRKSIRYFKLLCSPSSGTNTKVVRNIFY